MARALVQAEVSGRTIAGAIEVHRQLGPGLLESTYRTCLVHELVAAGLRVRAEVFIPISYKGLDIAAGYRADLIVEENTIVEIKAVEKLLPIHEAQLLTYLRLAKFRLGLLLNFNAKTLREGLRRFVK
jgi:GxxExxY protein